MTQTFIVTGNDDQFLLNFTLENSCASFANSLRRTIISGVDTAGFDTEDYETSSIRIIENTPEAIAQIFGAFWLLPNRFM